MEMRQLIYLAEVVKLGDCQLAAKELFISAQGLSKSIRQLEKEIGVSLMEKTGRVLRPTSYAFDLVDKSETLLAEYQLVTSYTQSLKLQSDSLGLDSFLLGVYDAGLRGDIFYGLDFSYIEEIIRPMKFKVVRRTNGECLYGVLNDALTAAVVLGKPSLHGLRSHKIGNVSIFVAMSANHPLSCKQSLSLSDLQSWAIACPNDLCYVSDTVKRAFESSGLTVLFEEVASDADSIEAFLCNRGLFITNSCWHAADNAVLKPLSAGSDFSFGLYLAHKEKNESDILMKILFMLRKNLGHLDERLN